VNRIAAGSRSYEKMTFDQDFLFDFGPIPAKGNPESVDISINERERLSTAV
jgi:hypothetical protein